MIFIDIDEYINESAISEDDLLIVDSIHIFNKISDKYTNIKIVFIKDLIDNLVYKEKIINNLEEKIILIDIITKKYPNLNTSVLLNNFLISKNNPYILNKSDILRHISTLYNQYLKNNRLLDYTLRLKELLNLNFENNFNNIILYGNFLEINELEWTFLKNYLKNINKLEVISNFKDQIIKIFYEKEYSNINRYNYDFIGFHPFSKFICNLIKSDINSFSDLKKILEQNFISLKEIKINDNEEIIFEGETLNFEQKNELELTEILNNLEKSGVKDLSNKEEVIKRIENYFYLRKQYAMDNEISEQKYEKDFYKTIIGWKILKQIISKIDYFISNQDSFTDFYRNIIKLLNFLGVEHYYKNNKIYKNVLDIFNNLIQIFDKSDYAFDKDKLYIYLKSILENTLIEKDYLEYEIPEKNIVDINKINDYYKKNNNYYNWSEYEGHLLGVKNDSIIDFYTSVTQIEEFSICPMKYFFNRKLKARTNLLIDNELDPILKGNLLHKILETFYLKLYQQNYFDNKNINLLSDYCKNLMINVGNEFFEPYNNIMDNLYLQKVKNELLDGLNENKIKKGILYKVLEKDNNRIKEGWMPSDFEKKFVIEINGLNFSGSIDRIDINSKNEFEILDYKTGNIFLNYKKTEIITGLSFQLPIYTIAYEKETGKNFHSASYFVLKENSYLDVDVYPIIDKTNYKFLTNKALTNLDKVKSRLLYSKYNYTTESTERICKSCDYKYICRINPLKSHYINNKLDKSKKFFKFIKIDNDSFINKVNNFINNINNKKVLIVTSFFNSIIDKNDNISLFRNEKDFLLNLTEINSFYDENRNSYLIDKFIEETIDKISYRKDKYLELILQILERKQIINFISNIIKSSDLDFYISNNFEDIWKNYTKKYLIYCDYVLNKINYIEAKIKNIPQINKDIKEYCNNFNKSILKIKEFINSFKLDKNNFNSYLDIRKSDYPIYSRNISEHINVSLHGEIINTIYFGQYSLINILNKFQYFSLEKEYIKAFYKLINEIGKITYDWKNKNNIFLYDDVIKKYDVKNIKNKILSKFDLVVKESSDNYLDRFLFKSETNNKDNIVLLNKQNNDFKIVNSLSTEKDLKMNLVVTKRKLDDLMIIPEIIYQIKRENKSIGLITNDDKKIKVITELFSKKRIKYLCSGYDLLIFQEIIDIVNILEFINNKEKYIELIGILRSPVFCLNDTEIYNITHDSDDILSSLKNLYPDIYNKLEYWRELSSKIKIDDLIKFIIEDSKISEYISLDVNYYTKNKNINKLIKIASKNNDCVLSEFIDIIKNCKYSNDLYSKDNEYINIMTIEKAKYKELSALIYLDTDELFANPSDDIINEKINNISYIGINIPFQKNNNTTESFTKLMIKEKYEEKILKKLNHDIRKINIIPNNMLIFIMSYKTINNKLFSKFSEINSDNINKIFV